ncbi:MAG: UvrD-helicase domain-containing protein [Lentisphaeria bacterium]|nr:UvrD-helicase domain-containing protein [Lentisphaeria bacterium]
MKYSEPGSVSISASAGYGKTEILCMRLLAIYLANPENIRKTAAMTFTRSAAGEMLERTFMLAAGGLADDNATAEFRKKIVELNKMEEFRDLSREELSKLLVLLAEKLNELNISTIDSFMISMAESYPMELGFFRTPTLVSAEQGNAISAEIIRDIFAAPDNSIAAACRESLIGHEKRLYAEACQELLTTLENCRDLMPEEDAWGRIPDGTLTDPGTLPQQLEECDSNMPAAEELYQEKLRPVLERCVTIKSAADYFSSGELDVLNKFFAVWDDFPEKKPEGFSRNWDFHSSHQAIRNLFSRARDILLIQAGVRTRAAYKLLTNYLALYREKMWQRGLIQFQDLPKLLAALPNGGMEDLQYRMNLKFRHFLFDEFQDTSRRQWQVFSPIVQDNGEEDHNLFLVGDIKQAIYGWREGDSRLMGEVSQNLPQRALPCAFRYGQAICDALNHLFTAGVANSPAIKPDVRTRWMSEYRLHTPFKDRPGYFAVKTLMPQEGNKDSFLEQAAKLIAGRLKTLDAMQRKLNCAILVRGNETGIQLRNALASQPGFQPGDFIWEGDESIANDRINGGLLALLYYLQHPADTSSAELLRMDPVLQKLLPETDEEFTAAHAELSELGLTGYLCSCFRKIAQQTGDQPGSSADALLNAAREFEASDPQCDLAAFREFARQQKRSEAALAGKIRLMSIHHSKGLTFDVTFYAMFPEKHGNFRTLDHNGVLMGEDWLLHQAGLAGLTLPSIRRAAEERDSIRKFEMLCLLYVALTRSKHEVHILIPELSKDKLKYYHPEVSELKKFKERKTIAEQEKLSFNPSDLVFDAFYQEENVFPVNAPLVVRGEEGYAILAREFGNSRWFEKIKPEAPRKPADIFSIPEKMQCPPRALRATPSKRDEEVYQQFRFPSRTGSKNAGTDFGTAVHAFFEKVEKWSGFTPPAGTSPAILRHWQICNQHPEITVLLDQECELWRERRFDIILKEAGQKVFLSGCFDRVQIQKNASGKPESAVIIDFKSNDISPEDVPETAKHYRMQMLSYRRALAQLLQLPLEKIDSVLLFTKIGVLHRISNED